MWELIRANRRKSMMLFLLMGAGLIVLGYAVGAAWAPPDGGWIGLMAASALWMFLSMISYFSGDAILLSASGAKEITRDMHPQLFNVAEEMKIAAGLPAMPKIYVIDEAAPNAFATGRRPEKAAIAVTAGLLGRMNRDELQGVVAHETSHILNRDILFMTFAGVMLGSITLLSQVFLRNLFFMGGGRYRSRDSRGGGQGAAIIMIVAVVLAILAPIMAQLLYFAISRKREYLADASAVRLTRYPEGLASALEKISMSTEDLSKANSITAPLYIANPIKQKGARLQNLTSTHPPLQDRIKILRAMAQGAGYLDYQEAVSKITGHRAGIFPKSGLAEPATIPLRPAGAPTETPSTLRSQNRAIGDLIRTVNQFKFLSCSCGLTIKVPPDLSKSSFPCPGCGKTVIVPPSS